MPKSYRSVSNGTTSCIVDVPATSKVAFNLVPKSTFKVPAIYVFPERSTVKLKLEVPSFTYSTGLAAALIEPRAIATSFVPSVTITLASVPPVVKAPAA